MKKFIIIFATLMISMATGMVVGAEKKVEYKCLESQVISNQPSRQIYLYKKGEKRNGLQTLPLIYKD